METNAPTVSEMVRNDYRTADVFKKWGINFCCGGQKSLAEVCSIQQLPEKQVKEDLEKAVQTLSISNALPFDKWPVDFLVQYLMNVHHEYLRQTLPALKENITSFISGHKKKYPYLAEVENIFNTLASQLEETTAKEEADIFPYILQLASTYKRKETYASLFVRTMRFQLAKEVQAEQQRTANMLKELRQATDTYQFAEKACTRHQVIYHKLREFDADLVQHAHLENNILYPRAIQMEQELLQL